MSKLKKLEHSEVEFSVEVSPEVFQNALTEAYIKTGKRYSVPGFRKGKAAPRKLIENMYGEGVFYDEAIEIAYPDAYDAAVKKHKITPVARPELTIEELGKEIGFKFTVKVAVKPEVTLGAYKGIEVVKQEYNVTDEMVDAEIAKEQEKLSKYVSVDRPVKEGDRVNLDYSGSVDGEKFDGGTASDQQLVIGSNTFIPGFESQMTGMKIGETKDLNVTFPEEYQAENLAGKAAVFTVTVKGIEEKELPKIDDEFIKDISEFNTVKEFKDSKRSELEQIMERNARAAKENMAISGACENAKVDIPEAMVETQISYMLNDIAYRLKMQGLSLEQYLKYTGMTVETMREQYRPDAFERVKTQLVMEAIVEAEKIKATKEDLDAEIAAYAEQLNKKPADVKKTLSDDDKEYFETQIINKKVIELVTDSAVEVKAKAEKKPAAKKTETAAEKKAPAKKTVEKAADAADKPKKTPAKKA